MLVSGVPRSAKPIVRGSVFAQLERFRLICCLLLAAIIPTQRVTLLHVTEYEKTFPALRLVKSALYDTMLLAFRWLPSSQLQHVTMQHTCRLPVVVSLRHVAPSHRSFSLTGTRTKAEAPSRLPSRSMPTCRLRILFAASGVTHAAGTPLHTRSCAWRSSSWPILPLETFCDPAFLQEFAVIAAMQPE
jgi:hypothetical protein